MLENSLLQSLFPLILNKTSAQLFLKPPAGLPNAKVIQPQSPVILCTIYLEMHKFNQRFHHLSMNQMLIINKPPVPFLLSSWNTPSNRLKQELTVSKSYSFITGNLDLKKIAYQNFNTFFITNRIPTRTEDQKAELGHTFFNSFFSSWAQFYFSLSSLLSLLQHSYIFSFKFF